MEKEGAYANLGNAYHSLGDFKKAIEYHEHASQNCQRSGRQGWRRRVRMVILATLIKTWETFKKAIEYHEHHLKIAKEVGDRAGEGRCVC